MEESLLNKVRRDEVCLFPHLLMLVVKKISESNKENNGGIKVVKDKVLRKMT